MDYEYSKRFNEKHPYRVFLGLVRNGDFEVTYVLTDNWIFQESLDGGVYVVSRFTYKPNYYCKYDGSKFVNSRKVKLPKWVQDVAVRLHNGYYDSL